CWLESLQILYPLNVLECYILNILQKNCKMVHVHNVQVCYICILVPCWCAAPINSSSPINSSFTSV
uniref:Uncharacterized protein n=1 Tax=Macaca fascicularis TaxID=9541 RepID=A0A7N9CEI1_MACFA